VVLSLGGENSEPAQSIGMVRSTVLAWPLAARAEQPALPVVGFVRDGSADANARYVAAFRKSLNEIGIVEGQNVTVEYHWR
jgi:putative tryptophan/tyrosine transport system substrate-binding protein